MSESAAPPKRERKQAEVYKVVDVAPVKQTVSIQAGTGLKLSDYPFFLKGLDKIKGDDDIVKCLHMLMFSSVGKKLEAKKNIRLFSGFADEKKKDERKMKVLENKKKWTIQMLKDTMSLFGLEKTGNRNELVEKFMDYLMSPSVIKDDASAGGLKKKTAASSKTTKTKGTKRKAKDSGAEPKKKRAPTSYILFAASQRAEIKTDNPDATFAEVGVLLGEKWKALDEDEKKVWTDLAAEKAAAMSEGNAPTEEADGEEADEDEENDDDLFGDGDALYGGNEKVAEAVVDDAEEGKTEVDNKTEEEEEKEEEADTEEKAEE